MCVCPYVQFLSPAAQILDRACGACFGAHFWIMPAALLLFGQVPSLILVTRDSSSSQNMECKLVLPPVCLSLSVLFPLCPCVYILVSLVYACVFVCVCEYVCVCVATVQQGEDQCGARKPIVSNEGRPKASLVAYNRPSKSFYLQ
jgi:hypothetical protein